MCHEILVGGLNPSEQYEFVNWDDDSQLNEKIQVMFQTTNQNSIDGKHGFGSKL